jgi:hypothetical protein
MMGHYEPDFISEGASRVDGEFDYLRKLVRKHKVSWEVWPEYHIDREGKRIQIGFELNLIGTHDHSEKIIEPGSPECMKIYESLSRIAHWITPREEDTLYEIGIFDASIHYSSQRRFRPEIILTAKILHKEGFDRPTDASEVQSLKEMEEKLERLGARKGNWGTLQ